MARARCTPSGSGRASRARRARARGSQVPLRQGRRAVEVATAAREARKARGGRLVIDFTVGIFAQRLEGVDHWRALVPDRYYCGVSGDSEARLRERMLDALRDKVRRARPADQELFQLPI